MDPKTKELTPEESLSIITNMIREAQGKVQKNSFYFLLWGWVVAIANVGVFILLKADIPNAYLIWGLTIPAWIITIVKSTRRKQSAQARTHFATISFWLWMSFGVSVFTLVAFGNKINYQLNPVILIISAIPAFVSGIIIRFKPLMIGGVLFWLCGIVSFFVGVETQPLIGALAIICGYLIPGYMLKNKSE